MTTWELIRAMVQRGFTLEIGPHHGTMTGYFAMFVKDDELETCDTCELPRRPAFWDSAGHAATPHRAIVMAAKLALGRPVTIPHESEFK
jgi:hypothetical protein